MPKKDVIELRFFYFKNRKQYTAAEYAIASVSSSARRNEFDQATIDMKADIDKIISECKATGIASWSIEFFVGDVGCNYGIMGIDPDLDREDRSWERARSSIFYMIERREMLLDVMRSLSSDIPDNAQRLFMGAIADGKNPSKYDISDFVSEMTWQRLSYLPFIYPSVESCW